MGLLPPRNAFCATEHHDAKLYLKDSDMKMPTVCLEREKVARQVKLHAAD